MLRNIPQALVLTAAFAMPLAAMAADRALLPAPGDAALPRALPLVLIQTTDGGYGNDGYSGDHSGPDDRFVPANPSIDAVGITPAMTAEVTKALNDAAKFCGAVRDQRYLVDCLSDQYQAVARLMSQDSGYAAARQALMQASRRLHDLAMADAVPGKAPARVRYGNRRSNRPLTPVADMAATNQKALKIVEQTTRELLRSARGSQERSAAYTEVAGALDSTKVLLRSA